MFHFWNVKGDFIAIAPLLLLHIFTIFVKSDCVMDGKLYSFCAFNKHFPTSELG